MIEVINELLSAFMVNVHALSLMLLNVRTLGILVVVLIMMVLFSNIYWKN
jgi:hypothetical protein